MNILVIGSGGREHALVWKLRQSAKAAKIYCAPGNPGIAALAEIVPLLPSDGEGLAAFARAHAIGLTVVGPEQPLADGIVDRFEREGLRIFGPTRRAAELEWSKAFAKDFMTRHAIPTAAHRAFPLERLKEAEAYLKHCPLPVVIKADGLAAGKGVVVCATRPDALGALHAMVDTKVFGDAGTTVVIEAFMEGEEASVFAISDGESYLTLAAAQDHKRVSDGDRGKNTGGMGAYAPTPLISPEVMKTVRAGIIEPTLRGMAAEGRTYRGCLYVGLMLTHEGPKVVEFNSRFGDPETQVILPLYRGDLVELLAASASGSLGRLAAREESFPSACAVCVVLASRGYPDPYPTGMTIHGLDRLKDTPDLMVFHAGTKEIRGHVVTSGGRVLGVTAVCGTGSIRDAIAAAYEGVSHISFDGMHFRRDIGKKALVH